MRTTYAVTLLAILTALPTAAQAQVYLPVPPVYAPAPPPHVYIHQRVRWHRRHVVPGGVIIVQGPPPVWVAPAMPPPPVYMAPPPVQPYYVQPQPVYIQPPVWQAPPTVYAPAAVAAAQRPARPQFEAKFGVGATLEGAFTLDKGEQQGFGVLAQMRYRAGRHFGLELMGGYERSTDQAGFVRTDVPITFGFLIPFLGPEYALSPYIVLASGVNFANLRLLDAPTLQIDDQRTQFVAQGGFGLELRLGKHFALNGDARIEGRFAMNGPSEAVRNTTSVNGKPVPTIEDSLGLRLGVGASLYF